MQAWKQNDNTNFDFFDAHDLNTISDSNQEETIKRKLREKLLNSKVFVILIGESTKYLYKFVRWEIEQALSLGLPIIAVNLNGKRAIDSELSPPILREELAIYISFNSSILQYALENWGASHNTYVSQGKKGPYYYKSNVYDDLGLGTSLGMR
ncbi:hypothetical protein SDC9_160453 [bioreactor metagenome]|uniref:Thoeris protein ThsB TIR-like domain-containing protein n=1 Tax=bioreactor metagenome TaxID=1076179 RepID=A0A645FLQ6_9ZZZZ